MRLNTKSVSKDGVAHLYDTSDSPVKLGNGLKKKVKPRKKKEK